MSAFVGYLLLAASLAASCPSLAPPVSGEVVEGFAPIGAYAGHWGIDFGVEFGTPVAAAASGRVTFAGSVAGMWSVTVDHGGGLKTSYSYLSEITAGHGDWVRTGSILGHSGLHHGVAALHFSVRLGGAYHDPAEWLKCAGSIPDALWLAPA